MCNVLGLRAFGIVENNLGAHSRPLPAPGHHSPWLCLDKTQPVPPGGFVLRGWGPLAGELPVVIQTKVITDMWERKRAGKRTS